MNHMTFGFDGFDGFRTRLSHLILSILNLIIPRSLVSFSPRRALSVMVLPAVVTVLAITFCAQPTKAVFAAVPVSEESIEEFSSNFA
jgi:hypothetical protein